MNNDKRGNGPSNGCLFVYVLVVMVFLAAVVLIACLESTLNNSNSTESTTLETTSCEPADNSHSHDWNETEIEAAEIVQTVELQAVASEGVEKVYLTRYRNDPNNSITDVYVAYDKLFNDINISMLVSNTFVEIEYITDGTPKMEKYEHSKPVCSECGAKLVSYEKYTYKFYIPEGTLLVRWDKTGD